MALTEEDSDKIDRGIASPRRAVRDADQSVENRSVDDLIKARQFVSSQITPTGARLRAVRPTVVSD